MCATKFMSVYTSALCGSEHVEQHAVRIKKDTCGVVITSQLDNLMHKQDGFLFDLCGWRLLVICLYQSDMPERRNMCVSVVIDYIIAMQH